MAVERLKVIKNHLRSSNIELNRCSFQGSAVKLITDQEFRYTLNGPWLTRSQRLFYEENGYVVIPDILSEEILEACRLRFVDYCKGHVPLSYVNITLMKDISLAKAGAKGEYLYNKAQDILYDEVFEKYFQNESLLNIVEAFVGPNIKGVHSMLINKPPDSGEMTSRHPLHQDLHYFPFRPADRIVAAWTAIDPATIDNGCLVVIPGSHRGPFLSHGYPTWEVNKAYHGIEGSYQGELVPLEMRKGETVFFHPLLIHGSGPNKTKGFRKAISCHFAASECYYIDVKGTSQENIASEIIEMAKRKGFILSIEEVWKYRSRLLRGEERTL